MHHTSLDYFYKLIIYNCPGKCFMNQPSNKQKSLGEKCHTLIFVLVLVVTVCVEKYGGQKEEEEGRRRKEKSFCQCSASHNFSITLPLLKVEKKTETLSTGQILQGLGLDHKNLLSEYPQSG